MQKFVLILILASAAAAQTHDHAQHGTVESRGNQAMGFDQQKSVHHFVTRDNGGFIQVTAKDAKDSAMVKKIQDHLKKAVAKFSDGDFSDPAFIHEQTPGVDTLKRLKSEVKYSYTKLDDGGAIVLKTKNAEALAAIREFFAMQIQDHQTGDPVPSRGL
jgi:hypothetical protein